MFDPEASIDDILNAEEEVYVLAPGDAGLDEALKRLRALKTQKAEIKEEEKALNKELSALEKALIEAFEERNVDQMRMPGVGLFTVTKPKIYPSLVDPEAFCEWLDERGEGGIARRTIHSQTLISWWNNRVNDGSDLPPEDIATTWEKRSIQVRKA